MAEEHLPADPRRIQAFARFFKNYMSVSSFVVAALPIPITSLGLIPTFADHRTLLATYTSLFCFLLLGFVFYVRHTLARWMFPEACVPEKLQRLTLVSLPELGTPSSLRHRCF